MQQHKWWTGIFAASVVTGMLAGCGAQGGGATMTPYEAQDKLVALMDRIQTELGGTWENLDDPSPLSCDVREGGDGVQFTATRIGSSPGTMDDAKTATKKLTELLAAEGYEVRESGLFGEGGYDLTMTNNRGSNLNFGANSVAMDMDAGSDCVPGDVGKVLDELKKQGK